LVLLHANETFKIFNWNVDQTGLIIAIAFAAGYSERFIVGAIERISPTDEQRSKNKLRARFRFGKLSRQSAT
jgi:hypothetical protein